MKTLILLFSVLFTTMSFAQVPSYVPASGLVGWWPFNGNANDESGNGNNGTVNGATLTSDRNGNVNSAYSFDGSSWIDILLNGAATGNNKITLSAWVYRNSLPNSVEYVFCYGATGNEGTAFGMGEYGSQGIFTTFMGSQFDAISNISLSINSWHNITSIHQLDGIIEIYLDGNLIFTTNVQTPNIQNILGRIGRSIYNGNDFWNGKLDDIGIWNRALTDCEIQNLYTSTNPTNLTSQTSCDSYTWNGQTYTQSGVYTGTTANCVTQALNLTINTNTSSSISQTALDSYTWPVNSQTYTTTGAYTAVILNAAGCDSTITLNLTMSFTGINDLSASKLSIYPNPTNGDFTITGLELVGTVSSLSLTDMNGKVVKVLDTKATKFSMGSIKPGVYFLNIISGNKQEVLKIIKE